MFVALAAFSGLFFYIVNCRVYTKRGRVGLVRRRQGGVAVAASALQVGVDAVKKLLVGKCANAPLLDVGYLPWKGRQSAAAPVAAAARRLHSARGLAELVLGAVPPVHCSCL